MISIAAMAVERRLVQPSAESRVGGETDYREVAHRSRLGMIADSSVSDHSPMPHGYEANYQLVLPYAGLFSYSVGQQSWLIDSNKILLIRPGWEFADGQPVQGLGHACLLINPSRSLVDEIFGTAISDRNGSARFGAAQSSPDLWLATQRFLANDPDHRSAIEADEWMVRALGLAAGRPRTNLRPATRAVRRAKEYLHSHGFDRLSLSQIAAAVGVSPVYLSNEFARTEGLPLYQYQLYLRLVRSLSDLRDCDDITGLALDLGFSSHSHFGSTFRRTFGVSPSAFRRSVRTPRSRLPDRFWRGADEVARSVGAARPFARVL